MESEKKISKEKYQKKRKYCQRRNLKGNTDDEELENFGSKSLISLFHLQNRPP